MNISNAISTLFSKPVVFPLLTILVSVVAVSALFQPGIILTHDGVFHLDRLVAFDQALHEGDFYPRWFPEFAVGYGYPLLNFYAPFSYYVAEFFHLLGFGLASAEKLTLALSLVLSGLAMYIWISEAFDSRPAGFLAAVAYMYFPYRMTDIYVRGALAECLAFVFLPFLLWSTYRLVTKNDRMHLVYGSVFLALLVLTHNITALFFVPIWFGYALLLILFGPARNRRDVRAIATKTLLVFGLLLFGIALSAFYWLPALQEQVYASISNFKATGDEPINQISAYSDLIQTEWLYDYLKRPNEAGFVQLIVFIICVGGLLLLTVTKKYVSYSARPFIVNGLFFTTISVIGVLMMSPIGLIVWTTVPLVDNIQFPWRLLTFVGLGTSVMSGLLALTKKSFLFLGLPAVAALAFTSMFGMPLLHVNLDEKDLSIPEIARHEFDSGVIAGTASAEYLPVWARSSFRIPDDNADGASTEQAKPKSNLNIAVKEANRDHYRLSVGSENGGPLILHQFFFPGWQAKLDGKETNTYPSTPIGLVTVDIPPGEHDLDLFFGDTQLRFIASRISAVAFLVLLLTYLALIRRRRETIQFSVPVLSIAAAAFYFSAGLPQTMQYVAGPDLPALAFRSQQFDLNGLRLSGFSLDTRRVDAERKIDVILYWQSLGTNEDIRVRLNVKNAEGKVIGSRLVRPIYGTNSTNLWSTDELVKDEIFVPIETSIGPGRYNLELITESEQGPQASVMLGNFDLPQVNLSEGIPSIQQLGLHFDGKMELVGYAAKVNGKELADEKTSLSPGDTIDLTLYWKSLSDMDKDYSVFLHLLDTKDIRLAQVDFQPTAGFDKTSLWLKGDIVENNYSFYLPERLPMGVYRLDMGLYYLRTMERLPIDGQTLNAVTLKRFKVVPKEQSKETPVKTTNILLGDAMRLVGATIGDESDGALHMKLFWQAEKEMDKDYTVFLHVLDSSGKVVAQVDRQPMSGTYPTSFWSPGENIVDNYDIILGNLPPGDYQLKAGAYFLPNMTNLTTNTGEANVDVGSIAIRNNR